MQTNDITIAHLIQARAAELPDVPILTFEAAGHPDETRTYRQLWENGQRLAAAFRNAGLRAGDRFALLMLNHPEFVESMIAAAITGTVFVPIDARTKGDRLAWLLRNSGSRAVVCADYALTALSDAAPQVPDLSWVMTVGEPAGPQARAALPHVTRLEEVLRTSAPVPDLPIAVTDPAARMQILYTSGTTGDPKGVVVSHARFAMVARQGETVFGYTGDDRLYTGLSLTHGNAQFVTLAPALSMAIPALISRKFTKSRLWDLVRAHGCTAFTLLGGMATALYSEPAGPDDAANPVRLVVSAGMPAVLWDDFRRRYGVEILEFYGAVEGGMTFKAAGEGPVGSCGRPAPGLTAKVVDETGAEVAPGEPGELLFRPADGGAPVVEYWANPEASRAKTEGGWLHSGDIVRMDAQSWVFFEYRKGGGIRRNGEFVDPARVEKAIAEDPQVTDVFVYGAPAPSGAPGERDIVAAVVPADAAVFDHRATFKLCRERLEQNCLPTFIQVVGEIPKTASEKPQERFLLRALREDPSQVFADTDRL